MEKIPLFKVFMSENCCKHLNPVIKSGYIGQGPKVKEFEDILKKHFNTDFLLTTNSCTSALQLANYLTLDSSERTEVIVSPLTCYATISAIVSNQLDVKWADISPSDFNIDLHDVERKLNKNTKSVVVVHWAGCHVNADRLKELQEKHFKLYGYKFNIIEDCAHCWEPKVAVADNSISCYSFQAIKFLTTGDGGLIILPDEESYKRAKLLRWFGLDRESDSDFRCSQNISESGFKYHLNDIAATIGISNFPCVSSNVEKHKNNVEFFQKELKDLNGSWLTFSPLKGDYWIFTLRVKNRPAFMKCLSDNGIDSSLVHSRCDKHNCVSKFKTILPIMNQLEAEYVSIPCGWWLSDRDRIKIVEIIKKGW